jgi:hypothetical protein
MKRHPTAHTTWCARDHRCNLGEHRADVIVIDAAGTRPTNTPEPSANATEHAEVRLTARLDTNEPTARDQVATLLTELPALLALIDAIGGTPTALTPASRPALPRRTP